MHGVGHLNLYIRNAASYVGLLILLIIINYSSFAQGDENKYHINTVVIDAGHGGKDPGAVIKSGGKEKDIALSIALKLGKYIETNFSDVKVVYTRKTDEFIELFKRAQIANTNNADLFICIHVNSSKKADPFGTETYVMGLHKTQGNLDVAMTENAVITKEDNYQNQYDGFDPHSPEAFIIFSLYQNAYLDQSLSIAAKIQDQFSKRVGRFDRGVKQAGFLVLWKTAMPSILIEVGFLSNPDEAKYLLNDTNQNFLASAIYRAFRDYKNEMEGNSNNTINTPPDKNQEKDNSIKTDNKEEAKIENTDTNAKKDEVKENTNNDFQKSAEKLLPQINNDTIIFRVQVISSVKPLEIKPENFKGLAGIEEFNLDGSYKYTFGKAFIFEEIVKIQKEIKAQYPDAFVIAIKNGKKIPVNEAIKQTKN